MSRDTIMWIIRWFTIDWLGVLWHVLTAVVAQNYRQVLFVFSLGPSPFQLPWSRIFCDFKTFRYYIYKKPLARQEDLTWSTERRQLLFKTTQYTNVKYLTQLHAASNSCKIHYTISNNGKETFDIICMLPSRRLNRGNTYENKAEFYNTNQ